MKAKRYRRLHALITAFDIVKERGQKAGEHPQAAIARTASLRTLVECFAEEYFSSLTGWDDGKERWAWIVKREVFLQAYLLSTTLGPGDRWEFLFRGAFEAHVINHLFAAGLVDALGMPGGAPAAAAYVHDTVEGVVRGDGTTRFLACPVGDSSESLLEFRLDAVFNQFRPYGYDPARCIL